MNARDRADSDPDEPLDPAIQAIVDQLAAHQKARDAVLKAAADTDLAEAVWHWQQTS